MPDARLKDRMDAQVRTPYPMLTTGDIAGVDMYQLDATIYGIATWYADNDDRLTDAHRASLSERLADLDRVWDQLPSEASRVFYATARDLARHLVATR
jgi:hypothetical protein